MKMMLSTSAKLKSEQQTGDTLSTSEQSTVFSFHFECFERTS